MRYARPTGEGEKGRLYERNSLSTPPRVDGEEGKLSFLRYFLSSPTIFLVREKESRSLSFQYKLTLYLDRAFLLSLEQRI